MASIKRCSFGAPKTSRRGVASTPRSKDRKGERVNVMAEVLYCSVVINYKSVVYSSRRLETVTRRTTSTRRETVNEVGVARPSTRSLH